MAIPFQGFGADAVDGRATRSSVNRLEPARHRDNLRDESVCVGIKPNEPNMIEINIRALYMGSRFEIQEKAISEGRQPFVLFGFERLLELIKENITADIFCEGCSSGASDYDESDSAPHQDVESTGPLLKDSWRILVYVSNAAESHRVTLEEAAKGRWQSISSKQSFLDAIRNVAQQLQRIRVGQGTPPSPSECPGMPASMSIEIDETSQSARLLPGARLSLLLCVAPSEQSAAEAIAAGCLSGSKGNISSRRFRAFTSSSSSSRACSKPQEPHCASGPHLDDSSATTAVGPLLDLCSHLNSSATGPVGGRGDKAWSRCSGSKQTADARITHLQAAQECLEAATRKVSSALAAAIGTATASDDGTNRTREQVSTVECCTSSISPGAVATARSPGAASRVTTPCHTTIDRGTDSTKRQYQQTTTTSSWSTTETSDPRVTSSQRITSSIRREARESDLEGKCDIGTSDMDAVAGSTKEPVDFFSSEATGRSCRSMGWPPAIRPLEEPQNQQGQYHERSGTPSTGIPKLKTGEIVLREGNLIGTPSAIIRAISCAFSMNSYELFDFLVPILLAGGIKRLAESLLWQVAQARNSAGAVRSAESAVSVAVKRSGGAAMLVPAAAPVLRLATNSIRAQARERTFEGFMGRVETAATTPDLVRCSGIEFLEFLADLMKHADRTMTLLDRSTLVRAMIRGHLASREGSPGDGALLSDLRLLFGFFDPQSTTALDSSELVHDWGASSCRRVSKARKCMQCSRPLDAERMFWSATGIHGMGSEAQQHQICCARCIALHGPLDNFCFSLEVADIE